MNRINARYVPINHIALRVERVGLPATSGRQPWGS